MKRQVKVVSAVFLCAFIAGCDMAVKSAFMDSCQKGSVPEEACSCMYYEMHDVRDLLKIDLLEGKDELGRTKLDAGQYRKMKVSMNKSARKCKMKYYNK